VANDTVALQNAFNAAVAQGRPCVITPGTYMCLNVTVPGGVRIRGTRNAVLKRISSAAQSVVLNISGNDVHLDDLVIDGNGTALGVSNSGAIQCGVATGLTGLWVRNCVIRNTYSHAMRLTNTGGDLHVIGNNMVDIGVGVGANCVVVQNPNAASPAQVIDVEIAGNTMHRYATNTSGYAVMVRGSDDNTTRLLYRVRVVGNYVDCSNGVTGSGATGLAIEVWATDAVIGNNVVWGGSFGISYAGQRGSIHGNTIYNANLGIEAIASSSGRYVACVGNVVDTCATGIVLWSADSRGVAEGNVVVNATGLPMRIAGTYVAAVGNLIDCPAATGPGIDTTQGFKTGTIAANVVSVAATATAIAVILNIAGQTERFTVVGNTVATAAAVGVAIAGSGGATSTQVGTVVGNDLALATTPIQLSGGNTRGQLHRWANAGDLPTITGSRAGNAALASFLAAQSSRGLITDSTTA